ncbi:hypothetical protein SPRG_00769 [Saprolegnia parasitica CBS 223.65]|uniref:Signal recognition particle receptor subunit beta n=1 Tax=Saprolegnia parasitica (strain CBS 223.65) TaxID=695850 RepID=A0A067D7V6_SAPPC|nr:hypothetical protein SPRG_00769 [Saprolegnia parasitica CBS 223.65]KDO34706.1 hypothetical protein SPRG_00769 [Saprolegnia parasitica CBS 223.65]|eukprot:XP_012194376.1 hypothetical protein SPRG_00769 [Saprolegnia parasitica CBS 223.65]
MDFITEDTSFAAYGAAAAAILILLFVLLKLCGGGAGLGGSGRDVVLLVGPCGAGKTALFHRLRNGPTKVETVTSMKETMETFPLFDEENATISICDFPGHERMRSTATQFYPIAKKIIFVVDATTANDASHIRKAAEFLYDIFTHPKINDAGVPVMIACSKTDDVKAATPATVQSLLETELTQLKSTRASLEAHGDDDESIPLGRDNALFEFAIDAPCDVTFEGYSIQTPDALNPLLDFIMQD